MADPGSLACLLSMKMGGNPPRLADYFFFKMLRKNILVDGYAHRCKPLQLVVRCVSSLFLLFAGGSHQFSHPKLSGPL